MKKIDNRGFMLVETLIVATFLVTVLLFIYIQFTNITKAYDNSFKYDTVNGLYSTKNIIKYISADGIELLTQDLINKNQDFIDITDCSSAYFGESDYCNVLIEASNIRTVLFTKENLTNLKNNANGLDQTIIDFINYIDYEKIDGYRVIIEFNDNTFASLKI